MRAQLSSFLFLLSLALPCFAASPAWCASPSTEEVNNGQDITRPLTRFDIRYQYENTPAVQGGNDDNHIVTLRVDKPFELNDSWKLATRFDMPLMFTDRVNKDNLSGSMHFGLSDILAQALLVNLATDKFGWAVGAQIVLPTASEAGMGLGKYRVVPTVGARWNTDNILPGSWFALAARWDVDFAESRKDSTSVSELQFAPIFNINLPDMWFINLFPSTDIRYNLGDIRPQDSGRLFLPFNAMVGKMLSRTVVSSLEVGVPLVRDYKVYDFKIEGRLGFFF